MRIYQIFIFVGVFILTGACLTGCSDAKTKDYSSGYIIPEELKDCKIFLMEKENGSGRMQVIRCPSSSTTSTYSVGKSTQSVTLLEEQLKAAQLKQSALKKLSDEEKQALGLTGQE